MKSLSDILSGNSYKQQVGSSQWRNFAAAVRSKRKACECCRRSDVELHVHHLFYDFKKNLWEYDDDEVIVLCRGCHEEIHEQLKKFRKFVFRYLNGQTFQVLNGALAVALTQYNPIIFTHALAEFVSNPRLVQNHADAWQMSSKNKTEFQPKRRLVEIPKDYKGAPQKAA